MVNDRSAGIIFVLRVVLRVSTTKTLNSLHPSLPLKFSQYTVALLLFMFVHVCI